MSTKTKNIIKIIIIIAFVLFVAIDTFKTQELQWDKYDLANYIGDFDEAELVDESEHLQVWYVYQNGDAYVVTIHNGELDQQVQVN